jgi:hypothetical protein
MHAARSEEMVHVLMEYGSDIELFDSEKWTPLHWFSRRNNVAATYAVLWANAEVDPIGGEWDYDSDGLETGLRLVWVAAGHCTKLPSMAMWRQYPHSSRDDFVQGVRTAVSLQGLIGERGG